MKTIERMQTECGDGVHMGLTLSKYQSDNGRSQLRRDWRRSAPRVEVG